MFACEALITTADPRLTPAALKEEMMDIRGFVLI